MDESKEHKSIMGGLAGLRCYLDGECYGTIECPTKWDFEMAKKAIESYYSNTAYIKQGACSKCGCPLSENTHPNMYCYNCGCMFMESDE